MCEILEVIMLICFGLSWPITLFKKLRTKNARSTSLAFMLLILCGYLAGITAKILSSGCNYVFFVYIFNVIMVLANLFATLYFRARETTSKAC